MKTRSVVLLFALLPFAAQALSRAETLRQVESSMLVKGTIETGADGSVTSVVLDQAEKFPAGVVDFVQKQVMAWKFEPVMVDGNARRARSPMSVRVVANRLDDGNHSIAIRNASFHGQAVAGESLTRKRMAGPSYPRDVAMSGASGVVYVLVRVGKDGSVIEAAVEQTNLKTIGTRNEMKLWRRSLASSALGAARSWTFNVPVQGEHASQDSWVARVPVAFHMNRKLDIAYGKWETYIPGPCEPAPWSVEDRPGFSPDALAEGGVYLVGQRAGLKLLTALGGG